MEALSQRPGEGLDQLRLREVLLEDADEGVLECVDLVFVHAAASQADDVEGILSDMGLEVGDTPRIIEVYNKVDLLDDSHRAQIVQLAGLMDRERIDLDAGNIHWSQNRK